MTEPSDIPVRVQAMRYEAQGVVSLELVPVGGATRLPAFTAGAHIDLQLPTPQGPLVRSYSLLNDPEETDRYCLGIHRDPRSRGGSGYVHDALRVGQVLQVSAPRNLFALDETSAHNVFIAGGIGITPLLAMMARSRTLGTPWTLHYATRTRAHAAFLDRIQAETGGRVVPHFDDESGGRVLDLRAIIEGLPDQAHVYCCGPLPMLDAFEQATAALPPSRVHREYFAAKEAPATQGGFTVELARSRKTLQVPPGKAILDCLIEAQAEPPHSCRQGVCGTCEVKVLAGTPDHRDMVLSDAERAENNRIMVCCSGSLSERLVLDL